MRVAALRLLGIAALGAALSGCDDGIASAQKAAQEKRRVEALKLLEGADKAAEDAGRFTDVMRDVGKARALAVGDDALLKKVEETALKARETRDKKLDGAFNKVQGLAKTALDEASPEESEKKCAEAISAVEKSTGPVLAKYGKELDALRRQLLVRQEVARRAKEAIAKANELKAADENRQARAVLHSFEVVEALRTSPFQSKVIALMSEIPDKEKVANDADAIMIFDGTDENQIHYFEREHYYTWKVETPSAETKELPFLLGENENSDTSTIWVGDDSWGDLTCEVLFQVGDVGWNFRMRGKTDGDGKGEAFDEIAFTGFQPNTDVRVKIDLKGNKATWTRLDTREKQEVALKEAKGKIGFTLPGNAVVKIREIKLRLADKDAKKPEKKVPEKKTDKDEPKDPNKKPKKKKKKDGEKDDEKKDDEKK